MTDLTRDILRAIIVRTTSAHQRKATGNGPCWCGQWPPPSYDVTYSDHIADEAMKTLDRVMSGEMGFSNSPVLLGIPLNPPPVPYRPKHRRKVP